MGAKIIMHISSSLAMVIYFGLMAGAYVFATFFQKAPFAAFATALTTAIVGYVGKRLLEKQEKYSNGKTSKTTGLG